jgi:hypothetical protein
MRFVSFVVRSIRRMKNEEEEEEEVKTKVVVTILTIYFPVFTTCTG